MTAESAVWGTISSMLLLVPSDPLSPRRADRHYASEAAAARELGCTVAVVDHDALQRPGAGPDEAADAVRRVPVHDDVVHRGWMLSPGQYTLLEEALGRGGARLRTSAAQYRAAHELPGWYQQLQPFTPMSVWTADDQPNGVRLCCQALHGQGHAAAVLRDFSKSEKHHWDEAAFIPDLTDIEAALRVARRFRELRGDGFAGGYVLRAFEDFCFGETRSWWVDGRCVLQTAHPDTPLIQAPVPQEFLAQLAPAIAALDLPFVTADLVLRSDKAWRVVEVGEGQVSDRPFSCAAADLLGVLDGVR